MTAQALQDWNQLSMETRVDGEAPKINDHYHDSFELYYLQKGTCWYFIDRKSYHLTAGDIALIPAGVIHKTSYETLTSSRVVFNCADSLIPQSVRAVIHRIPYFARDDDTAPAVDALIEQIQTEYNNPDSYSMDAIRLKVGELFLLIARESAKPHEEKQESPLVEKAASYIRKHYMEAMTLQDAAKYCYVSREHLSRIFKKETGFGFNEYLSIYRLKKANSILMENPKIKVSQVAMSCGFSDSNYFSKQYKKMFGVTPSDVKRGE